MRTKCFAIVLAAIVAVLCVPTGSAFAAQGELVYTLEDGSTGSLVDSPDAECAAFMVDNGIVEAVNNTDRVAELAASCENESDKESASGEEAESEEEEAEVIAALQPGESYRLAEGDLIPLAVTFVTVRSRNSSTAENPGTDSPSSPLDPRMIAPG